jgi:hypothetical protein
MSSEICFRDKMISIKEAYAEIIVCFLLAITKDLTSDTWLDKVRIIWQENRTGRGLGMTSLELDRIITTDDERQRMASLLEKLDENIEKFGAAIPADIINSMKPPYTVFVRDVSVERVRRIVERIRALLEYSGIEHQVSARNDC